MLRVRLTDPALDFWSDVRLRDFGGRWLAVADLADTSEVGTGDEPAEALRGALAPFRPAFARSSSVAPFVPDLSSRVLP